MEILKELLKEAEDKVYSIREQMQEKDSYELHQLENKACADVAAIKRALQLTQEKTPGEATQEQSDVDWEERESSITCTNDQWSYLRMFILMTTKYRSEQIETWESIAKGINENEDGENGCEAKRVAVRNAIFWEKLSKSAEEIEEKIHKL